MNLKPPFLRLYSSSSVVCTLALLLYLKLPSYTKVFNDRTVDTAFTLKGLQFNMYVGENFSSHWRDKPGFVIIKFV